MDASLWAPSLLSANCFTLHRTQFDEFLSYYEQPHQIQAKILHTDSTMTHVTIATLWLCNCEKLNMFSRLFMSQLCHFSKHLDTSNTNTTKYQYNTNYNFLYGEQKNLGSTNRDPLKPQAQEINIQLLAQIIKYIYFS